MIGMTPEMKLAKALLRLKDQRSRRRHMFIYAIILVVLFAAHAFFTNMDTPLKLIPQMLAAIGMGYVLSYILSVRQFKYLATFIDWENVSRTAEPGAET